MSKIEVTTIICGLVCATMFVLGLAIPTVYFGFKNEDSLCQEGFDFLT